MPTLVLLIAAFVSFILAAANVPRVNWIAVGLALVVLTLILPLLGVAA